MTQLADTSKAPPGYSTVLAATVAGDADMLRDCLANAGDWASVILSQPAAKDNVKGRYFSGDPMLIIALCTSMDSDDDVHYFGDRRLKVIDVLLSFGATFPAPVALAPRRQLKGRYEGQRHILSRIVSVGACSLVSVALKAGYDFTERRPNQQYSLLHEAVGSRDPLMVKALLEAGCDYTLCSSPSGLICGTPVHAAAAMLSVDLLAIFFTFDESRPKSPTGSAERDQLVLAIMLLDAHGNTLLDTVINAKANNAESYKTVRYLLDKGHPMPVIGTQQAVAWDIPTYVVRLLLDYGCDPTVFAVSLPFTRLVRDDLLELLLEKGLEVRGGRADGGLSILHSAVSHRHEESLRLMLANGSGPDMLSLRTSDGSRPVDMAGAGPWPTWLKMILARFEGSDELARQ